MKTCRRATSATAVEVGHKLDAVETGVERELYLVYKTQTLCR